MFSKENLKGKCSVATVLFFGLFVLIILHWHPIFIDVERYTLRWKYETKGAVISQGNG